MEPVPHRKKRRKLDSGKSEVDQSSLDSSWSSPLGPPVLENAGPSTSSLSPKDPNVGRCLALDCEMVGVGINASRSSLARVSLVDYDGVVVLDEYVKQREPVVDYRTRWSGITALHMVDGTSFVLWSR